MHYNALGLNGWLDTSPARDQMEIIRLDVCDRDSVLEAMRDVQVVFHLAALIAIPYSYHAPSSYVRTNIEGTLNMLQSARTVQVERFIQMSSSEVYGTARYTPIDEAHPLQGQSPYSASKIGADKIAESFYYSFGTPIVTARAFNTFGPRQSARAVIPTIILQCLKEGSIHLGNLSPRRDLNYVSNTVEGLLLAGSRPGIEGQTINLGSGREISIGDLVELIGNIMHVPVPVEVEELRVRPPGSEVERLLADNSRARQLLGWQPKVSLEDGLMRTIAWIEQNLERYHSNAYTI